MLRTIISVILLYLVISSAQVFAEEGSNFAVKGAGVATCERFLSAKQAKSGEYYVYGGWIEGFITAVNQSNKNLFDLTPWQTTDLLVFTISKYCEQNLNTSFYRALATILQAHIPTALREESTVVNVKNGDKAVFVYGEIVKRLQKQLSEEKLYDNEISGKYNTDMQNALLRYQEKYGLNVTGLPDQATLVHAFSMR